MASKWSSGPAFLWQNEDEWPVGLKKDLPHPSQVMSSDSEVKRVTVLATINYNNQLLPITWNISPIGSVLEGAMAVCLLYLQKLQEQVSAERKCSNTKTII